MKPGLYLLLFLLLTVYRVVQMSVLLTRQAMLDANGMMMTTTMTIMAGSSGTARVGIVSDPPIRAAASAVAGPPCYTPTPQRHSTSRHGASNSLRSAAAAAAPDGMPSGSLSSSSRCRRNDGSTTIVEHLPMLNDPTVRLTPCLPRKFLPTATATSTGQQQRPNNKTAIKTKIWLTSFGWNHPNRTLGITYPRSQRTRELLQAIVDHPDFDPAGWDDYPNHHIKSGNGSGNTEDNNEENVRHLVFLDVETCHEGNYPHYGRHDRNQDNDGGRPSEPHRWNLKNCYTADNCSAVQSALASPLFASTENNHAKLVYLDCKGNGVTEAERNVSSRIAFVSLSSHISQLDPRKGDQGLPPPVNAAKFQLTPRELQQVQQCDESHRPYLLSFVGALRRDSPRDKLVSLHNDNMGGGGGNFTTRGQQQQQQQQRQPRPIFAMSKADFAAHQQQQQQQQQHQGSDGTTYESLLRHSLFAAAPRGTNLFSYRFAEALALGAIPVVHSDGWVLPFTDRVVDWSECAVIIPERRLQDTPRILQAISDERRCQMRKACVDMYQRYMSSPSGTVQGILEGLLPISEKP
jgi:Exostosin family